MTEIVHSKIRVDDEFTRTFQEFNKELKDSSNYVDNLTRKLTDHAARVSMTQKEYHLQKAAIAGATEEQKKQIASLHDMIDANGGYNRSAKVMGNNMRWLRGMGGQLGHQLQDIAVQAQMGTNGLIILGQQGSQIASIMGPTGAIVGGVIAVAAALGSALLPSLFESTDALKALEESTDSLTKALDENKQGVAILSEEYLELARDFREATKTLVASDLYESNKRLKESYKSLKEEVELFSREMVRGHDVNTLKRMAKELGITKGEYAKLRRAAREVELGNDENAESFLALASSISSTEDKYFSTIRKVAEYNIAIGQSKEAISDVEKLFADLDGAIESSEEHFESATTTTDRYGKALDKIIAKREKLLGAADDLEFQMSLGGGDDELAALQEQLHARHEVFEEAYKTGLVSEEQHIARMLALGEEYNQGVMELDKKRLNAQQASQQQMMTSIASSMSQYSDALHQAFGEASALGKAFFAVSQTIAAANVIIQAESAAMNVLNNYTKTGLPGGEAAAIGISNTIKGMGYASAGAIMGQTIASFDGGGITFDGPDTGGVDGKGGRLAVVHPREKISPESDRYSGSGAQTVMVNFNLSMIDTRGAQQFIEENRATISNEVRKALNNKGVRIGA